MIPPLQPLSSSQDEGLELDFDAVRDPEKSRADELDDRENLPVLRLLPLCCVHNLASTELVPPSSPPCAVTELGVLGHVPTLG